MFARPTMTIRAAAALTLRGTVRWRGVLLAALLAAPAVVVADDQSNVEEMVVRAESTLTERFGGAGSLSLIDEEAIARIRANHVHESLVRAPGVWISRGSGQEHLTAMRSAVLTGAGACGEFLFLEDGVPIRPAGFCNLNNLFEINTEQAAGMEVYRGPASALLGGNALRGSINVITPGAFSGARVSVEGGSYDYHQIRASIGGDVGASQLSGHLVSSHSNGYRDDTGFGQQKLSVSHAMDLGAWTVRNTLNATLLNQETGGFVRGFEAYDDGDLRDTNPNPEAYRDAWSWRAASHWRREDERGVLQISPYARRSGMAFLQHFLPGQPLEENDQTSAGAIVRFTGSSDGLTWQVGGQVEWMSGALQEFQDGPTIGSPFLGGTRPEGLHYDYEVDSLLAAVDGNLSYAFNDAVRLVASLRGERISYDYDNLTLVGNTRDDGTECGFGGCLYTRPADRDDDFDNIAYRLGVEFDLNDNVEAYVMAATGFRPPQATELYRLQSGQLVTDLDSEEIQSVEAGLTGVFEQTQVQVAIFGQSTDEFIFRDSEGFNVSDGETESYGLELEVRWQVGDHELDLVASYTRHEYAFDRAAALGEQIRDGNDVDTAPRILGSARWLYRPTERITSELEAVYMDEYYTNAANTQRYDGHEVFNWRGRYQVNDRVGVFVRVLNVLDERYADRADFAFGSHRYFPAMPRQVYLGAEFAFR